MVSSQSFLAQLLEARVEERREELAQLPLHEVIKQEMEDIGLYVYESTLDPANGDNSSHSAGKVTVASDGAPERAKVAVETVLKVLGVYDFGWIEFSPYGPLSVTWEVTNGSATTDST